MERFAAGFRNPIIREELGSALDRGRGVFRAFKDTLSRHPEAEKLWFTFKEKEMRRQVINWYNGLREEWGLEKIGKEPEETGDLVLEDFHFRPFQNEDISKAEILHRQCLEEYKKNLEEAEAGLPDKRILEEMNIFHNISDSAAGLTAETSGGEFAGYISGITKDSTLFIQNLEVKTVFRGLGVGEALLENFISGIEPDRITSVLIDLPSPAEGFSRVLTRESFKPYTVRYRLNLKDRKSQA
jgi:ribosomal protein S18 acetylase RimI-like enzyme